MVCISLGSLLGLFPFNSSVYVSWLCFHSRPKIYLQLPFVMTALKFYSGVFCWFSFILNLIICEVANMTISLFMPMFVTWYFCFPHKDMSNKALVFSKTCGRCACFFFSLLETKGRKLNIWWRNGRGMILFYSKCKFYFHW